MELLIPHPIIPEDYFDLYTTFDVKLTQYGAEEVNLYNQEFRRKIGYDPTINFAYFRTDYKDGDIYRAGLWEIMMIFGGRNKSFRGAYQPFTSMKHVKFK